jgi:hypothetical protein
MMPRPALSELDELQALLGETQVPIAADALLDLVGRRTGRKKYIFFLPPISPMLLQRAQWMIEFITANTIRTRFHI